jgi:hypothetical protein
MADDYVSVYKQLLDKPNTRSVVPGRPKAEP